MPAFAQFTTTTIGRSAFFKSLRSRLLGSRGQSGKSKSSSKGSGSQAKTPTLVTFGGNQTPRRKDYLELSDTALLTNTTTQAGTQIVTPEPSSLVLLLSGIGIIVLMLGLKRFSRQV